MTLFLICAIFAFGTTVAIVTVCRGQARRDAVSNMLETENRALRRLAATERATPSPIKAYDADDAFHDAWIAPAQETIDYIDRELGIVPEILPLEPDTLQVGFERRPITHELETEIHEVRSWDGGVRREVHATALRAVHVDPAAPMPEAKTPGWERSGRDGSWAQLEKPQPTLEIHLD